MVDRMWADESDGRWSNESKPETMSCMNVVNTRRFVFICGKLQAWLFPSRTAIELQFGLPRFTYTMAKKSAVKKTRKTKGKQPTRRRGWTSDEQFTYLNGLIPSFKTAQVNNTTQEMWSPIENYWFKTWPLPDLTEAETSAGVKDATRRKKIMDVSFSLST